MDHHRVRQPIFHESQVMLRSLVPPRIRHGMITVMAPPASARRLRPTSSSPIASAMSMPASSPTMNSGTHASAMTSLPHPFLGLGATAAGAGICWTGTGWAYGCCAGICWTGAC